MVDATDPPERMERLLDRSSAKVRRDFIDLVRRVRDEQTLEEIERLIVNGNIDEAIRLAANEIGAGLAASNAEVFAISARGQAQFFLDALEVRVDFDATNDRAVRFLRRERLGMIQEFTEQQRAATREALVEGTRRGLNPRDQARRFRDSVGLTARQQMAVQNYRRALEDGSRNALDRALRDRRFDRTVERAISGGTPLTSDQIETMVSRYRDRYIKFRAETIARTEALRAVHSGADEMFEQAFESGKLNPSEVERTWNTRVDGRERETHEAMHGQKRGARERFQSPSGAQLRYPGDPLAPAEETIKCRCVVTTRVVRIDSAARAEATSATPSAASAPATPAAPPAPVPVQPGFKYETMRDPEGLDELATFITSNGIAHRTEFKGMSAKNLPEIARPLLEVKERFGVHEMAGIGPSTRFGLKAARNANAAIFLVKDGDGRRSIFHMPTTFGRDAKNLDQREIAIGTQSIRTAKREKILKNPKVDPEVVSRAKQMDADGIDWTWTRGLTTEDPTASRIGTVYHEMGHVLHLQNTNNPIMMDEINSFLRSKLPNSKGWHLLVSDYAGSHPREYVAETFALYMAEPESQHYRIHPDLLAIFRKHDRKVPDER